MRSKVCLCEHKMYYPTLSCCHHHFFASDVPVPVTAAKRPEAVVVEPLLMSVPGLLPMLLQLLRHVVTALAVAVVASCAARVVTIALVSCSSMWVALETLSKLKLSSVPSRLLMPERCCSCCDFFELLVVASNDVPPSFFFFDDDDEEDPLVLVDGCRCVLISIAGCVNVVTLSFLVLLLRSACPPLAPTPCFSGGRTPVTHGRSGPVK